MVAGEVEEGTSGQCGHDIRDERLGTMRTSSLLRQPNSTKSQVMLRAVWHRASAYGEGRIDTSGTFRGCASD